MPFFGRGRIYSRESGMELKVWKETLEPYQMAVNELTVKFQHVIEEYHLHGEYCPIVGVSGRVKTISSILDKCRRKNIPVEEIEDQMYDIAGIRLIVQFVEDIEIAVQLIRKRTDMEIKEERDYVRHSKESGYRSYHMIIRYQVQTIEGPRTLYAEIQIRTLGMNFWAAIEHSLQYKYKESIPENISYKLLKAAQAIVVLDSEMSAVRGEIMDAQMSMQHQQQIVSDILETIHHLYKKTNRREVEKIEDEFYRVYQQNDIEKLERFARDLDLIAEGYEAQDAGM